MNDPSDSTRTARWHAVRDLLESALEQPAADRDAWLERETADDPELLSEVRALLDADRRAERFLEVPAIGALPSLAEVPAGTRFGAYEIVRALGRGGMGRVLLAVRADDCFRQVVAIKIADRAASPESERRFRRERQILADLDHPNIARLLDGGTTSEGVPYLVMEYVEGQRIDRWIDENRPSVASRLALFRKVLGAVAYAHRHLVVHLDLKPTNILVTPDGEPKLLDFGIAKILATEHAEITRGARPLTLAYASPEQVAGARLTTASDIYSSGVVLYRLLTGRLPHDEGEGRIADREDPVAPSQMTSLRTRHSIADLDAVVLKALRREVESRYGSAVAFDEDLRRFLANLPVDARRGTWRYRGGRFLRRHWLASGLAAALFLATLVSAVALSLQARRLAEERDRAEVARAEAESVGGFLGDLLSRFEPGDAEGTVSVIEVLDRGMLALQELAATPAVEAELALTLGNAYRAWSRYDDAVPLLERALAARLEQHGTAPVTEVAAVHNHLGQLALERGDYSRAVSEQRHALALLEARFGEGTIESASTLMLLGDALFEQTELEASNTVLERACDLFDARGDSHLADSARCGIRLARGETRTGQLDSALARAQKSVRALETLHGEDHHDVAVALNVLATILINRRDFPEAEATVRRSLAIRRETYGDDHVMIAESLNNLATVLSFQSKDAEAEVAIREALAIARARFGPSSDRIANVLHNLAVALRNQQDWDGAEAAWRESIAILERGQPDSPLRCHPLVNLADMLAARGRGDEALALAREAHAIAVRGFGAEHPLVERSARQVARLEREPVDQSSSPLRVSGSPP